MWTLPDSDHPAFVSVLVNAFWPNHNFCQWTDCFLPIWVADSCPLYYVFPADLGQGLLLLLHWPQQPLQPSVGGSTTWSRSRFLTDKGTFSLLLLIVGLETLGFYRAPKYNFTWKRYFISKSLLNWIKALVSVRGAYTEDSSNPRCYRLLHITSIKLFWKPKWYLLLLFTSVRYSPKELSHAVPSH